MCRSDGVVGRNGMGDVKVEAKVEERDGAGRFARGNRGGPGNPFARQVAQFRAEMIAAVSVVQFRELVAKLMEMALGGNLQAMKVALSYLVGKPGAAVNPDLVDIDEWDVFKKEADMERHVSSVIGSEEPGSVLQMGREVKPLLQTDGKWEKELREPPAPTPEEVAKLRYWEAVDRETERLQKLESSGSLVNMRVREEMAASGMSRSEGQRQADNKRGIAGACDD